VKLLLDMGAKANPSQPPFAKGGAFKVEELLMSPFRKGDLGGFAFRDGA
jgi:hypothetical protein